MVLPKGRKPSRPVAAAAALALVLLAGGCRRHPPAPPPPPFVPTVVATLPFDNATASIDAPKHFRAQLHPRIARKGYLLQPLAETDARLDAMGIQLGGQIKGVQPKELREKLGADLAIWGTVREASSLVTGVYNRRSLEVEVVLTDLRSGEVVWTDRRKVVNDDENFRPGNGLQVLAGVAEGVVKKDLAKEHARLAEDFAAHLPWCPRQAPPPSAAPAPAP